MYPHGQYHVRPYTIPLFIPGMDPSPQQKSLLKATIFLSMGAITVKIGSDTELIQ